MQEMLVASVGSYFIHPLYYVRIAVLRAHIELYSALTIGPTIDADSLSLFLFFSRHCRDGRSRLGLVVSSSPYILTKLCGYFCNVTLREAASKQK